MRIRSGQGRGLCGWISRHHHHLEIRAMLKSLRSLIRSLPGDLGMQTWFQFTRQDSLDLLLLPVHRNVRQILSISLITHFGRRKKNMQWRGMDVRTASSKIKLPPVESLFSFLDDIRHLTLSMRGRKSHLASLPSFRGTPK